MRILNVTAQKPNSTGSGIFLSELMKEFANKGHTQALVAGVYPEEKTPVPDRVTFYPVYFEQGKLNFPIVGMSDEMPYPSTRYRDMTPKMEAAFKESFLKQLDEAVRDLNPDLILCHHLYLLTAIVREHFPDRKVFGFCHNTDLRQMQKLDIFAQIKNRRKCVIFGWSSWIRTSGMTESKSVALPLGDTPTVITMCRLWGE